MFNNSSKIEVFVLHPTTGHRSYDVYKMKYQDHIRRYLEVNNCKNLVRITQAERSGSKPDVHMEHSVCWRSGDILIEVPEGVDVYWGIRDFLENLNDELVSVNDPRGFRWSSPIELSREDASMML